jgi:hypothetical protein
MRRVFSSRRQSHEDLKHNHAKGGLCCHEDDGSQASTKDSSREDNASLEDNMPHTPLFERHLSSSIIEIDGCDENLMQMANGAIHATRSNQRKRDFKTKEERQMFN